MPVTGQGVERALDRLPIGVPVETQHLVVVPFVDRGHVGILAHETDTATISALRELLRYEGCGSNDCPDGRLPASRTRPRGHDSDLSPPDGHRPDGHRPDGHHPD